ncbi:MAG: bifunctional folylpolyglutamate synthase/dihydrofolate synthase [Deltaproteobacteria bacterium]|nr:bifunctional folylpolyglutamate synthase/dihydrofolate synthase [Deltaproteobacteria bacterium]
MATDAYVSTLAWLYRLEARRGIDLELARVRRAAAALGHPERAAPTFHVAGTNGKGSTAAMLAAMLAAAGARVGLYTSPHLVSFRERIQVAGTPITEAAVVDGIASIRAVLGPAMNLTCFEVATLLAWETFRAAAVDAVVLEVGLGGRLDATNVVTPAVAVVTNVGLDHEAWLGDTLAMIAREKAGVVKAGVPVVSGATGVAGDVVAARARELGSPLEVIDRDFALEPDAGGRPAYRSPRGVISPLTLGLAGAHQRRNAALAIRALECVPRLTPSDAAIRAGLADVRWPGRLQVVRREPLVLLDGAHNGAGVEALAAEVRARAAGRRVRVLFGVMRDKGWQTMLRELAEVASEVVVTRPRQPRSASPAEVAAAASCPARVIDDPAAAYRELLATSAPDDVVVAAGSLFLVGDLLPVIDPSLVAAAERERAAAVLAGRW